MSERPRRNDNLQQVTTSDLLQELSNRARSGSLTREQLEHLKRFAEVELKMIANEKPGIDQAGRQTSVVSVPNKQPQVEQVVDREALLLKEIVSSITRWTAHGKMAAGTRLNGMPIVYAAADVNHGANPELIEQIRDGLTNRLVSRMPDDSQFAEYLNAHYFSIEASPVNPGLFIGEYSFFQEPGDPNIVDQRNLRSHFAPCTVRFELPKEQAKKLWEELGKNPDFLNLLYLQAFDGIEDPDIAAFGFRRVKSRTLYMAQRRDVAEIPFPERLPREKIPQIIGSLHEVKYKRGPYGIGTPKSSTASQP